MILSLRAKDTLTSVICCLLTIFAFLTFYGGCGGGSQSNSNKTPVAETKPPTPKKLSRSQLATIPGLKQQINDPLSIVFTRNNPVYFMANIIGVEDYTTELEEMKDLNSRKRENLIKCFNEGVDAYLIGEYQEAIEKFTCAKEADSVAAMNNLASSLVFAGETFKAYNHFEKLVEKNPNDYRFLLNLAYASYSEEQYAAALTHLKKVTTMNVGLQKGWHLLGLTHMALNQIEESLECFQKAVNIFSENHLIWRDEARALLQLNRDNQALNSLNRSLRIQPDEPISWEMKGIIAIRNGYQEEAIEAFEKLTSIDSRNTYGFYVLGAIYYLNNNFETALENFGRAVSINDDCGNCWIMKAKTELALHNEPDAVNSLNMSLKAFPQDASLWMLLGQTYHNLTNYKEAVKAFDKALLIKPDFHEAWRQRGLTCIEQGKIDEAKRSIQKAISYLPEGADEQKKALEDVLQSFR